MGDEGGASPSPQAPALPLPLLLEVRAMAGSATHSFHPVPGDCPFLPWSTGSDCRCSELSTPGQGAREGGPVLLSFLKALPKSASGSNLGASCRLKRRSKGSVTELSRACSLGPCRVPLRCRPWGRHRRGTPPRAALLPFLNED